MHSPSDGRPPLVHLPDGTVKQVSPLTGTVVWTVPGRAHRPLAVPVVESRPLDPADADRRCAFCAERYLETPPEKARVVVGPDGPQVLRNLPAEALSSTVAELRRIPNLFEIVSVDYWRANYGYRVPDDVRARAAAYVATPAGREHVLAILHRRMASQGVSDEVWAATGEQALARARRRPLRRHARRRRRPAALRRRGDARRPARRLGHADARRAPPVRRAERRDDAGPVRRAAVRPVRRGVPELAPSGGRVLRPPAQAARGDRRARPEHGPDARAAPGRPGPLRRRARPRRGAAPGRRGERARGRGGRRRAPLPVARGPLAAPSRPAVRAPRRGGARVSPTCCTPCTRRPAPPCPTNEEWHHRPPGVAAAIPWHVVLKWRVSTLAGFEGGTKINVNTLAPGTLRDRVVAELLRLRDAGAIAAMRIGDECARAPGRPGRAVSRRGSRRSGVGPRARRGPAGGGRAARRGPCTRSGRPRSRRSGCRRRRTR